MSLSVVPQCNGYNSTAGSCFSRIRLCATPQTAAHQAPLSLVFYRQEHWSGLPFPSPMHKSESEVPQSYRLFTTPWTAAYQAPPSMGFSRQDYWSGLSLPSPKMPINSLLFNLPLHIPMSHFISFYVVCLLTNYNIYICFYYSFPLIFILK